MCVCMENLNWRRLIGNTLQLPGKMLTANKWMARYSSLQSWSYLLVTWNYNGAGIPACNTGRLSSIHLPALSLRWLKETPTLYWSMSPQHTFHGAPSGELQLQFPMFFMLEVQMGFVCCVIQNRTGFTNYLTVDVNTFLSKLLGNKSHMKRVQRHTI